MPKKRKNYYSVAEILKADAQYNIIYGQKGNGKSYAIQEHCIKDFIDNGKRCIYMRRYANDIKTVDVERYWLNIASNEGIRKLSKGKYSIVTAYQGKMYLGNFDEHHKRTKELEFGDYLDLNRYQHYASQAFPGTGNIILEEFITDNGYLENESNVLQKFVNTILRDENGKVWMAGNTISRVCPYFQDFGLKGIRTQEQGTIDLYSLERYDEELDEVITTRIAVERCAPTGTASAMIFGKISKHIVNGDYDVKEVPILQGRRRDFPTLYQLAFEFMSFRFIIQLKIDESNGGLFVYVYPDDNKIVTVQRLISSQFSTDPLTTEYFNSNIKAEMLILDLINKHKVCYSDILTGNDFEQVLTNWKGRR